MNRPPAARAQETSVAPALAPAQETSVAPGPEAGRGPSLTLAEAAELALASHPDVAAAEADLASAAAGIGIARAAFLPGLRTDASLTRYEEPTIVAPLHELNLQSPPDFERTLIQGSVSLAYTLFDGGSRGARLRSARARRETSAAALRGAELDLVVDVAESYLRTLTAGDVLEAQDRRIEALEGERGRVKQFLDQGRAPRVELLRAEAALARARADRVTTDQGLDLAAADLARLTGLSAALVQPEGLAPVRAADTTAPADRDGLLDAALDASPEVAIARGDLAAAEAERSAARAEWFPDLEAVAGFIERGSTAGDYTGEWQAGLQLGYPLFTGGARAGEVSRAGAAARAARERVRAAELSVASQLDRALAGLHEQRARVSALAASAEQSEEVARIERLALDAGRGVQTDYLTAEADLLDARAALIQARNDEVLARVRLARVTGDLSPGWISRSVETVP